MNRPVVAHPSQTGKMLISLIILTYNRSDALLTVLDALCQQTDMDFEVVIADDGSHQEHVHAVTTKEKKWPFPLCHAWHPDVGFTAAAARNMGARLAKGTYLIFLDGDCIPLSDFIQRHRTLARENCFVNGSRVLLNEKLTFTAIRQSLPDPRKNPIFWLRQRFQGHCNKLLGLFLRWPATLRVRKTRFHWRGIRSCNFGLWYEAFERVDGFDEAYDGWGHEDADLVLRLHRAGYARIDGFWATEVLHLWHRQASRSDELANRRRFMARMRATNAEFKAEIGLHTPRTHASKVKVRILSP